MVSREELKASLRLYKESLGREKLEVKEDKRQPVAVGQLRELFWMPHEYVLVYHIEDEGLAHCVPLTVWANLTTSPWRLHAAQKIFAPLPFVVYLRKEILERESLPVALLRQETVKKLVEASNRAPTWSVHREKRTFLKLVWKRYQDLTLASIIYTHQEREA